MFEVFERLAKSALLLTLIICVATVPAIAAIPNNSVIIGAKGFSIDYLMLSHALPEINQAIAEAGDAPIYYQLDGTNEVFADVFTNQPITPQNMQALPQITYKEGDGKVIVYAEANGEPIGTNVFEVISIE